MITREVSGLLARPGLRIQSVILCTWIAIAGLERLLVPLGGNVYALTRDGLIVLLGVSAVGRRFGAETKLNFWIVAWFLWCLALFAAGGFSPRGIGALRWYLLYPALMQAVQICATDRTSRRRVAFTLFAVASLNALIAILQFSSDYAIDVGSPEDEDTYMTSLRFGVRGGIGLVSGRPILGVFLVAVLCYCLLQLRRKPSLLHVCMVGLLAAGIMTTLSRGSWVAAATAIVASALAHLGSVRKSPRSLLALFIAAGAAAWAMSKFYVVEIALGANEGLGDNTLSGRTSLWQRTVGDGLDPMALLIGAGPGTVGGSSRLGVGSATFPVADSMWVHLLLEVGVVGLILLVGIWLPLLRRTPRLWLVVLPFVLAGIVIDTIPSPIVLGTFFIVAGLFLQAQGNSGDLDRDPQFKRGGFDRET